MPRNAVARPSTPTPPCRSGTASKASTCLKGRASEIGTADPRIGANPPVTARWGDCTKDWPRENIVSPYPFATAAEHYAALKADAAKRGGPTKHTYATMPKWDGVYGEYVPEGRRVWNYGRATQVPTFLSILTPEYQQRDRKSTRLNSSHANISYAVFCL